MAERAHRFLPALTVLLTVAVELFPRPSAGSAIVVPDDLPTIQAAVYALPDTVLVRTGTYDEDVVLFRGIAVLGYGTLDHPQVRRILIEPTNDPTSSDAYAIEAFTFDHGIRLRNNRRLITVSIDHCELLGGIADSSSDAETGSVRISKCSIHGDIRVLVRGSLVLDSCHVDGHVSAGWTDASLDVWHCRIEGDGTGTGIASEGFPEINEASIYGNRITGFDRGIEVIAENNVYIRRNSVEGAGICGVMVGRSNEAYVDSNRVESCGDGIVMNGVINGFVRGNTILRSTGTGIRMMGERSTTAVVGGNVLAMGAGNGIEILSELGVGSVTNNTVAGNGGSGLVMAMTEDVKYGPVEVAWNVASLNQQYGIEWLTGSVTVGGCNDWFENAMGNVWGRDAAAEDFSEDPLFCDPAEDDYSVNSGSPLLSRVGCEVVGALGPGCGMTATLVRRFAAVRVAEGIQIIWEVGEGATASEIWVERSEEAKGGGWVRPLAERSAEGRTTVELDRSALRDRAYTYRLVAQEERGAVVLASGVMVEAEANFGSGLIEVGPNPSREPVRIVLALKDAGWIEIGLYDVQGRRVISLGRGMWPAGRHALEWDGLSVKGDPAPPGVYVLRYAYPGGQGRRILVRQ